MLKKPSISNCRKNSAFTLVELLVVIAILSFVLVALLRLFVACGVLVNMSQCITAATIDAQNKIEEIRNSDFDDITTNYVSSGTPGNTFNLTTLTGKGVIYIDSSNPDLLQIDIVVCFQDRYGRIYGEDVDLDGALDGGEDLDGDNRIDSLVTVSTLISEK